MGAKKKTIDGFDDVEIRKVAAFANVDPRTVRRVVVDGAPARSARTLEAIANALRDLGFTILHGRVRAELKKRQGGRRAA